MPEGYSGCAGCPQENPAGTPERRPAEGPTAMSQARPIAFWHGVRKGLRYAHLYGIPRTWSKVRSRLAVHTKNEPRARLSSPRPGGGLGMIGCGNFAHATIAYYAARQSGRHFMACSDANPARSRIFGGRFRCRDYGGDWERVIADPDVDMVFVASHHSAHAAQAAAALRAGKATYVEKPIALNEAQLRELIEAAEASRAQLYTGYNRPHAPMGRRALQALASQEGLGMYSWFVVGHQLPPDHWYLRPTEGGRILGNLCHWIDFTLHCFGDDAWPIRVVPARGSRPDIDLALSLIAANGSVASLAFSERGETFEGVRERFSAQRGNVIVGLDDFSMLSIDEGHRRRTWSPLFRDHGHRASVREAVRDAFGEPVPARREALRHIADSAWLTLRVDEAARSNQVLVVGRFPFAGEAARAEKASKQETSVE